MPDHVMMRRLNRMCFNKTRFSSIEEAKARAALFAHKLFVYQCKACGEYHLTKDKPRGRQKVW